MRTRIGLIVGVVVLLLAGLFTAIRDGHEGKDIPIYETDEATLVTFRNLPEELKESLTEEEVALILELEFSYMEKIGLVTDAPTDSRDAAPELDMEAMAGFIRSEAAKAGKTFSTETILSVLAAEDVYLRQEGIIEE